MLRLATLCNLLIVVSLELKVISVEKRHLAETLHPQRKLEALARLQGIGQSIHYTCMLYIVAGGALQTLTSSSQSFHQISTIFMVDM